MRTRRSFNAIRMLPLMLLLAIVCLCCAPLVAAADADPPPPIPELGELGASLSVVSVSEGADCAISVTTTDGATLSMVCSNHGSCLPGNPPVCECHSGYAGSRCEMFAECTKDSDCFHGACDGTTGRCHCESGWIGLHCMMRGAETSLVALPTPPQAWATFNPLQFVPAAPVPSDPLAPAPLPTNRRIQMLYTSSQLPGLEDNALITQISLRYTRLPLPSVVTSDDPAAVALTKFQISFSIINSTLSPLPSEALFTSSSSFLNAEWTAAIARRSFTTLSAQPRVSQELFNDPAIRSAFGNPVAGADSTASAAALPPASGGAAADSSLAFVQLQPDVASALGVAPSSSGSGGWMHIHLPSSAHFRWHRDLHFVLDMQCQGFMPFTSAQTSGLVSNAANAPAVGEMEVGGAVDQGGAFEVASSLSGMADSGRMLARVWAGEDATSPGAFSNTTAFDLLLPLRLGSAHWAEAPYIHSIVPTSGSARGGTEITVSGSNFPVFPTRTSAASEGDLWNVVLLNEHACTAPRVISNSSFTCRTPLRLQHDNAFPSQVPYTLKFQALSSGLVVSSAASTATFTYNSPPIVYDVTPRFGGPGTRVQLIGAYFGLNSNDVASVRMGNISCGSVEFASSNLITCTLSIPQERNTVVERTALNTGEPKSPRVAASVSDGPQRNDTDAPTFEEPDEEDEDPALEVDIGGLKETLGGEENLPIVVTTVSGGSSLQNDENKSAAEPRTTKSFTFQVPPVLRVSARHGNDSLCSQPALGLRCASLGQALRLFSRAGATFLLERGTYRESMHGPLSINSPQISIQSLGLNPSKVKMLCAAAGCFAYGADDHELQEFTAASAGAAGGSAAQMRYFFPRVIAGITFEPDWALQEQLQAEAEARAAAEAAAAAEAGVPVTVPPAPSASSFINNQSVTLGSSTVSLGDSLLIPGPPASSFFTDAGGAAASYGRGVLFHLALANRLVDATSSAAGSTCGIADHAATNNNAAAAAAVARMVQQNTAAIRGVADVPLPVPPTNSNETTVPPAAAVLPPSTLTSSSSSAPMLFKYCVFSRVLSGSGPAVLVSGSNVVFSKCRFESNLNVASVPSLAAGSGGALLVAGASNLMVSDSVFEANAAHYGGAIVVLDSSLVSITSTAFHNNTAWQSGGALFLQSGAVANISSTTFLANRAGAAGGATFVEKATLFLREVDFTRNALGLDTNLAVARAKWMKGSIVPGAAASAAAAAEATLAASAFSNSNNGLGGGALRSVVASLHLLRVSFDSNHAGWPALGEGGAIHATYSTLGVDSCAFEGNMASRGGALALDTLSALFAIDSTFANNIAGYGMTQYNAATTLLSIRVNSSINLGTLLAPVPHRWGQGGALFLTGCVDSSLERVRFTNNLANDGGAVYFDRSSNSGDAGGKVGGEAARASSGNAVASILNATFTGNTANGRSLNAMADVMAQQAATEAAIAAELEAAEASKQGRGVRPGKRAGARVDASTAATVSASSDSSSTSPTQKTNSSAANSAAAAASLQVASHAVNGGGAIVSVTAPFACTHCTFASNSAPLGGGGAILWQDDYSLNQQNWLLLGVASGLHPELASYFPRSVIAVPNALTTFEGNTAMYGPNFATVPSWIRAGVREEKAPWRIFPLGSTAAAESIAAAAAVATPAIKEQSSGWPLKPSLCVELLDAYGQLVSTDDSSLLRVRVVTTAVSTDRELLMPSNGLLSARSLGNQLEQTGQSYRNFISGRANFTDLGLVAQPGSNVTLTFESVLASGSTISTAARSFGPRWSPLANHSSASIDGGSSSLILRIRSCAPPTEYLDPESNRCVKCAVGTRSFEENAFQCVVQEEKISSAQLYGLLIIFVLFLLVECAALVGVVYYRNHRVIFSASPLFCCVILSGGIVTLLAACIMVLNPAVLSSVSLCTSSLWLLNLGFMLSFGGIIAKTYRLWRIFDNALFTPVTITNRQLITMVSGLIVADAIVIAVWQGIAPERIRIDRYRVCVSELSWVFTPLLIALKACLLLYGSWLTYQIRSIPSAYNESKFLGLAMFSVGFVAFVVLGLEWGLGADLSPPTLNLIQSVGVALGSFLAMLFIFTPHAHNIWRAQKERREHEAIRAMKNQIKGARVSSTNKAGSDGKRGSKGGAYAMASGSPTGGGGAGGGADSRQRSVSGGGDDEFDFHPPGAPLDVSDFTLNPLPIPGVIHHLIKFFAGKSLRHPLEQQFVVISTELSTAIRAESIALKRLAESRRDVMSSLYALSQIHFEIEFQKESHPLGVLDPARCKVWPDASSSKRATGSSSGSARNSTAGSKPVTQPNSRRSSKIGLGAAAAAGSHALPASVTASNSSSTASTPRTSVVQRGSFDGSVRAGSGELELTRLGGGALLLPPSGASSLASSVAPTPDRSAQVSRRPSQVDVLSTIRDLDAEAENALLSPIMSQAGGQTPLPGETPNTALTNTNSEEQTEWGVSPSPSQSPNPTPSPSPAAASPEDASSSPAGSPSVPAGTIERRPSFGQAVLGVFDSHHLYPPARRYSSVRASECSPVLASPSAPQGSDVENPSPITPGPSASPPAPHAGSSMVSPQLECRHLLPANMSGGMRGAFRRGPQKEKPPLPRKMRGAGSARGSADVSPAEGNTPTSVLSPSFGPIVPSNPTVAAAAAQKLLSLSASPSPSPSPLSPPPRWNANNSGGGGGGMGALHLHPQLHQPLLTPSPSPSPSPNPPSAAAADVGRLVSDFSHATPPLDRSSASAASGQRMLAPNLRIHPRPNRSPGGSPGGSATASAAPSASNSAAASPAVSARPSPTASPTTAQRRLPHAISVGEQTAAASGNGRHSRSGSIAQAQMASQRDQGDGNQL